nr:putative RNA-directed DNA polymerase [Tanacetum cinerariifolium]
ELFGVESPLEESPCSLPLRALCFCLLFAPYAALSFSMASKFKLFVSSVVVIVAAIVVALVVESLRIQAAQDRQKSYADLKRKPVEFEVGDRVMLKKCYADEPLVMPLEGIHVDDRLQIVEEPVKIMERVIKRLKRSWIPLVKVRWNSRRGHEFTWEREDSKNKGKSTSQYSPEESKRREVHYPISNYMSINQLMEPVKGFAFSVSTLTIPESVEEALNDSRWVEAMTVEMNALEKNNTWKLVSLPKGKKSVGCKWEFQLNMTQKEKLIESEESVRVKAREIFVWVEAVTACVVWENLSREIKMKNLGGLKYFLGIEVARCQEGIFLPQRKYIVDLLAEVGLLYCKPEDTPSVPNLKLGCELDQAPANKESVVSQFMKEPKVTHMEIVMHIISYLKGAPGRGIQFTKNENLKVRRYTDADWAGNKIDCKSQAGYFTFVEGNLVTWRSKKQNVLALSSAEAEFRGTTKEICELLWLRMLLTELGFEPKEEIDLHCDNKAAIAIAHNPVQHERTKHVEVDQHFIKDHLDKKTIRFPFVKAEDEQADVLTKAVSNKVFHDSLIKLGNISKIGKNGTIQMECGLDV